MAGEIPIGGLQLNFTETGSKDVVSDMKALATALKSIKTATKDGVLSSRIQEIQQLGVAINGIKNESVDRLNAIATALTSIGSASVSSPLAENIKNISEASNSANADNIKDIADAVKEVSDSSVPSIDMSGLTEQTASSTESVEDFAQSVGDARTEASGLVEAVATANSSMSNMKQTSSTLVSAFNAVAQAMGSVKNSAPVQWVFGKISDGAQRMGRAIEDASKKNIQFGNSSRFASSRLGGMLSSLKRVAKYRIFRSIIKGITDAVKEGVSNLYAWSNAFDSTREFANSMDMLATSAKYLKNSFGALVAPIINALAPAIDWLVDKIVGAINVFNRFIAILTGADTYTVAKKVATSFNDTAKSASKAAKAVKSYTIGIDELNIIEKESDAGGGGGTSSKTNAEDWFDKKETNADTFGSDLWNNFKDSVEEGYRKVFGEKGLSGLISDLISGNVDPDLTKYGWIGEIAEKVNELADAYDRLLGGDESQLQKFGILGAIAQDLVNWSENLSEGLNYWIEALTGFTPQEVGERGLDVAFMSKIPIIGQFYEPVRNFAKSAFETIFPYTLFGILSDDSWEQGFEDWLSDNVSAATRPMQGTLNIGAKLVGVNDTQDLLETKDVVNGINGAMVNLGTNIGKVKPEAEQFWDAIFGNENGNSPDAEFEEVMHNIITLGLDPLQKAWDATELAAELGWMAIRGATGEEIDAKRLSRAADEAKKYGKQFANGLDASGRDIQRALTNITDPNAVAHLNTKRYKHEGESISVATAAGIVARTGDINRALTGAIEPQKKEVKDIGYNIGLGLEAGIKKCKSDLTTTINTLIKGASAGTKSTAKGKEVQNIGKWLVEGLIAGVNGKKKDLEDAMKKLAKAAEAGFAAGAQIGSPSKLMEKDGVFMVQGVNRGIEKTSYTTIDLMKHLVESIADVTSNIDLSNIALPNIDDIAGYISGEVMSNNNIATEVTTGTLEEFMTQSLLPIIQNIATDTKRQADKPETTEVVMNTRAVASAVKRQNRTNGYSFTGG